MDTVKLAQLTEDLAARQAARDFVHALRLRDLSVPRAPGAPGRVETLREILEKKLNGGGEDAATDRKALPDLPDGAVMRFPVSWVNSATRGASVFLSHDGREFAKIGMVE